MTQTRFGSPRALRIVLLIVTWFNLGSALFGAPALASGWITSMGLPLSLVEGSVFADFFWPGIILGVIVGGTQLAPIIAYHTRFDLAWGLFATAGFGNMIWIFVETGIVRGQSFLQILYFSTGLAQVLLVLLVLGVWPRPFFGRDRVTPAARTAAVRTAALRTAAESGRARSAR